MIARYRVLAERLRAELQTLERVVARAEEALSRATRQVEDEDFFAAAAALDLHGFYAGLERLFELIANEIDTRLFFYLCFYPPTTVPATNLCARGDP